MTRLSAADQAAFRRWANSLGCVCKICNHTAASIQAFVTHLRQAHDNMSTATYTNMHGPYTTVHKCKLCGNELNGGFNDLKDHLNRRHNGMTITNYFLSKIKPTLDDEAAAAASEGPSGAGAAVAQDMSFLESLEDYSDFAVVLEDSGERLKCHKVTLAKWSPVLDAMLKTACVETQNGEIKIRGYDDKTVKIFIEYLYQGQVSEAKYTLELLRIFDQYQVKRFFSESFKPVNRNTHSRALETLVKKFTEDNVVEFWKLAEIHGAKNLTDAALNFMIRKGKKLLSFRGVENLDKEQLKTLLAYALDHPRKIPASERMMGDRYADLDFNDYDEAPIPGGPGISADDELVLNLMM